MIAATSQYTYAAEDVGDPAEGEDTDERGQQRHAVHQAELAELKCL